MALTEARKRATVKYKLKAYGRIYLEVKKEEKQKIEEHAQERSESLNGFIKRAITNQITQDNAPSDKN